MTESHTLAFQSSRRTLISECTLDRSNDRQSFTLQMASTHRDDGEMDGEHLSIPTSRPPGLIARRLLEPMLQSPGFALVVDGTRIAVAVTVTGGCGF